MRCFAWQPILHISGNRIFHFRYLLTWIKSRCRRIMRNRHRWCRLSRLINVRSPRYLSCLHHDPIIKLNVLDLIRAYFNRKRLRNNVKLSLLLRSMVWVLRAIVLIQNTCHGNLTQFRTDVLFRLHDNNRAFLNESLF